jgi:hypothetical protein
MSGKVSLIAAFFNGRSQRNWVTRSFLARVKLRYVLDSPVTINYTLITLCEIYLDILFIWHGGPSIATHAVRLRLKNYNFLRIHIVNITMVRYSRTSVLIWNFSAKFSTEYRDTVRAHVRLEVKEKITASYLALLRISTKRALLEPTFY